MQHSVFRHGEAVHPYPERTTPRRRREDENPLPMPTLVSADQAYSTHGTSEPRSVFLRKQGDARDSAKESQDRITRYLDTSEAGKRRQRRIDLAEPQGLPCNSAISSRSLSSAPQGSIRRPALEPVTPNISGHPSGSIRHKPNSMPTSCSSLQNKPAGRIFSNSQSPRKFLWPTTQQKLSQVQHTRKMPNACDNRFRQNFGPPRKPQPSFQPCRSSDSRQEPLSSPRALNYDTRNRARAARHTVARYPPSKPAFSAYSHPRSQRNKPFNPQIPFSPDDKLLAHSIQQGIPTTHPKPLYLPEQISISEPATSLTRTAAQLGPGPSIAHAGAEVKIVSSDQPIETRGTNLRFYAARILPSWQVWVFRILFGLLVVAMNVALLVAYFKTNRHLYLLAILAFVKSKDLLCTITDVVGISYFALRRTVSRPKDVSSKWIVSLICAYAETDEQIMKTFRSLAQQDLKQHKQIVCIILDGKNPDILSRFSKVHHKLRRTYFTWKGSTGDLIIYAGILEQTPTIFIRKIRNAGKKDSLILGHDIFNYPRSDMPRESSRLRREIFTHLLPSLTGVTLMSSFDFVFCTDADSTIHPHSLQELADTLSRQECAIAGCGVLVAEIGFPKLEWTAWHLYQQFQYTFGQYVRRQAEGIWGRVTCLPGCITMIKVRPEMGKAISMYAQPVTSHNILEHQVQYLGTDRRLTYCILAQGKHLRSLFVPGALCETVVPNSLEHYLSQRRRWASNAYFNDYYYGAGKQQLIITRLIAVIDIVRQTLVFYRVINTGLFVYSLVQRFYIVKIIPTLILTKAPVTWFMFVVLVREKVLRQRMHKLVLGMCINQIISPILSVIVFANVLLNVGSQVWGTTGASTLDARHPPTPYVAITPQPAWSPKRLASIVRNAVRGVGGASRSQSYTPQKTYQQPERSFDRGRAESLPITPGMQAALAASNPASAIRFRTSMVTPLKRQSGY